MNERILELADKAIEDMPGAWNIPDEFCEKFAELIVQECIEAIQNESMNSCDDWERGLRIAEGAIAKHFGVEE